MFGLSTLSFSAPLILSALAILPAVYFLLRITPPAPDRKPFPAFSILRTLDNTITTARRTPPWLLLLRLLVLGFLICGLAGPILNAPPETPSKRPLLVVVDNTWAAAADWRARENAFAALTEEARANNRPIRIVPTAPEPGASIVIDAEAKPQSDSGPDTDKLSPTGTQTVLTFSTDPYAAQAAAAVFNAIQPSTLAPDYRAVLARVEEIPDSEKPFDVRWLSDGLAHTGGRAFAKALEDFGTLKVLLNEEAPVLFIPRPKTTESYTVARLPGSKKGESINTTRPDKDITLIATARDGRIAARSPITFDQGATSTEVRLNIPIALRNEIAKLAIEGTRSAGALRLIDGRERRALIGIAESISAAPGEADNKLLSGAFFVRKALEPSADFISGDVRTLASSDASVIVLDDVGRLRVDDEAALSDWMENGGVLIRFAGDLLAEAVIDQPLQLSPTLLRGGGRAFGGALSWETPQPLGPFAENGPFSDLVPPTDVFVKRQVLARPGGETSAKTWASLADGTPLVTGERRGSGALVLFHVTATPEWSDLPLAQIFVDMLQRLTALSAVSAVVSDETANADLSSGTGAPVFPAINLLNGFGDYITPPATFRGGPLSAIDSGRSVTTPPGLYGSIAAPLAVNVINSVDDVKRFSIPGVKSIPYTDNPPKRLGFYLFLLALILFSLDAIFLLRADPLAASTRPDETPMSGRTSADSTDTKNLGTKRVAVLAFALFLAVGLTAPLSPDSAAHAQPLDQSFQDKQFEAALQTRFAHVITGDAELDRLTSLGLNALSEELTRRTAVEPAKPHGVNLETDDLTLYPLLYWPITADAPPPPNAALANLELFMRFGGLVIFDTRDDEQAVSGVETPERRALKEILKNIDTPPLRPLPEDHVLKRSFYLLPDLPGRARTGPIWVQSSGEANDAVTPLIIAGRDWAGAWARDAVGRHLRPIPQGGGGRLREFSYRAGVNIAMVALTGNYKSDQVHTPVLLERLGK